MRCVRIAALVAGIWGIISLHADLPEGYGHLVLNRNASDVVEQAAKDLSGLLEKMYGEAPFTRRSRLLEWNPCIHIGPEPYNPAFDADPLTDEVLIERRENGLHIVGSDNSATAFAVYRFLEEFLGWRYYQPGPLGLEQLDSFTEPPSVTGESTMLLLEKAGYYSRNLSIIKSPAGSPDWVRWNGLRERFQYNHSLHRIITPDQFDSHPDWFAKDSNGKPKRPPFEVPHGYNDHPDLTNPEMRKFALQNYRRQLASIPSDPARIASISLSLGDSYIFGNFADNYGGQPEDYFRRWPNWSNHVFDYTNYMADKLTTFWGGTGKLYLGALSYLTWEKPPEFDVHPNIVPYLTFDRSQWHNPQARENDLANVKAWADKGLDFLGTWDYLFGYGFLMPRSMTEIVSDSIPELYRNGVRAYYSQVLPLWPYDAHTTWLTAKLLWNPEADSQRLMGEFYREFFGPAAAPMRQFFNLAENTWMHQDEPEPGHWWWLRYWKDPWQAALWKDDVLQQMQKLLDDAAVLAGESGESRHVLRVKQTTELFKVTRLFIRYQQLSWKFHDGDLAYAGMALATRKELVDATNHVIREYPSAAHASDLSWIYKYESIGGELGYRYSMEEKDAPQASIISLMNDWCRVYNFDALPAPGFRRQVLYDTDFSDADNPRIWRQQFLDSQGLFRLPVLGTNGYTFQNARRGSIYQMFRSKPGNFYLGSLQVETRQSPSGQVFIRLDFFDEEGSLISESDRSRIAPIATNGSSQTIHVLSRAPERAASGRLFIRLYELDPEQPVRLLEANVHDLGQIQAP